jgi:ABC-type branched-subunit amino acid transport system ATPase component
MDLTSNVALTKTGAGRNGLDGGHLDRAAGIGGDVVSVAASTVDGMGLPRSGDVPLLEAVGVTVRFGGVVALDEATIRVSSGGTVGLVGPNGAGKTTLFGVLSGLVRPASGVVRMNGVDVTSRSPQARARMGLSRTFQRMELFTELTVLEHLVIARRVREGRQNLRGFFRDLSGFGEHVGPEEAAAIEAILELVGLAEVADRPTESLPLGAGRLVEVARALAAEPTVMLLDEPSSGLDAHETEQLGDALRRVREERGAAFVLVEHNVEFVLDLSDRITVLDFGKVLVEGTPDEIRRSPDVQAAYLGAPTDGSAQLPA